MRSAVKVPPMPERPEGLPDRPILFIVGLHRSGASLLHRIVRAHPEISGFKNVGVPQDEGQHLQTVFPTGKVFGGPGRFGFDPRAHMDEHHPLAGRSNAIKLSQEWARYWDLTKPMLVEKSPPTIMRMRFFQKLFPAGRFVLIFRHPIIVALATQKSCYSPIYQLIDHCLHCYELAVADAAAIRDLHRLRYEIFVANPQEVADSIWRFAGVGAFAVEQSVIGDINARYFEEWQQQRHEIVAEAERQRPDWLALTVARCRALGYALDWPLPIDPTT